MNLDEWVIAIMEQLGYAGIALLMFLDNVFPPLPSEIIMPSAGFVAARGELTLTGVIIAGSIGSLIAAAVLYGLGRRISQSTLLNLTARYGKYLMVKPQDVKKALDWFEHYGHRVVFIGRMVPAVRSLISIPAGMSHMPFWKFMFYSSLGTIIWTTFLACVGFYFGENLEKMDQILSQSGNIILVLLLLSFCIYLLRKYGKKSKI